VRFQDKTCTLTAFFDTGNILSDGVSGLPIVLVDISALEALFYDGAQLDFLARREIKGVEGRVAVCSGVCGSSKIFLFSPQEIWIYCGRRKHRIVDVMIGVDVLSMPDGCKALVNPSILAEV